MAIGPLSKWTGTKNCQIGTITQSPQTILLNGGPIGQCQAAILFVFTKKGNEFQKLMFIHCQ